MIFTDRAVRGAPALAPSRTVAYFCAEYGITDTLPIYSGGLGVLAGDIVQEAAVHALPFMAIGLFYRRGYFSQKVDSAGQHESPQEADPVSAGLEPVVDAENVPLVLSVPIGDRDVRVRAWRKRVRSLSLLLLDTDMDGNTEEDRRITAQLYAPGQEVRVAQEMVLGIGGYRLLKALNKLPTLFHLNEGHAAFAALELTADIMHEQECGAAVGMERARERIRFTNHTLVAAGNDAFPHELVGRMLGRYAEASGFGMEALLAFGASAQAGVFSMTELALRAAKRSNAVSRVHAQKAVDLWPKYHLLPLTNGVHLQQWVAPEWQATFDAVLPRWRTATADPKAWKPLRCLPRAAVWRTHQFLKARMLDGVYARTGVRLETDVLTLVWARRFATYKRPDLLFHDLDRLQVLLFDADRPVQVVVAGKAHPADEAGKEIIRRIENLANEELKHRAVFVDDYSITLAKQLVAGADVWLNTPIYGLEASGTSGMKAAANGAIQFTTPDGWTAEVDWYGIGYEVPLENAEEKLYEVLAKDIIPSYYRRGPDGVPPLWTAMMLETIAAVAPTFSATRMLADYCEQLYRP